jgi:hypothetical protein
MSILNKKPATQHALGLLWKRIVVLVGSSVCVLSALMFYPPAFEAVQTLLLQPISSAIASDNDRSLAPSEVRKQRVTDAKTAVHGMYVKDPYGCVYMFQYVSAQLSLAPVVDEQKQPVCK